MAVCLLFVLATVFFTIAAAIAKTSRRRDAGEVVRDVGIGTFIAACCCGSSANTHTRESCHSRTFVRETFMDDQLPGRSLLSSPRPHRSPRPDTERASKHQLRVWADAAVLGDADAFARLYAACRGWVLARCRARLSACDAEDVCAEVFARTWRHLHAGKSIEHPLAWLATVTRHLIIDHHKRVPVGDLSNDTDRTPVLDLAPGPADLAADIDVTPLVRAWLAELSPQARAAVTGHLSVEEQSIICARTGCSLPALRSSLYRSRQRLRVRLAARDLPCPPLGGC